MAEGPQADAVRRTLGATPGIIVRDIGSDEERAIREGEVHLVVVPTTPPTYRFDAARDESRYGPAKLIGARMRAEGIDISDEEAVGAFMERFNERLAKDPTLLPSIGRPRGRWTWDGKGEPPHPVAPCPCGSGRRYRKCCMPR